jgi:D-3-phosphoglycerate dehydrogenase
VLAGAGLDVFPEEPPDPDDPLLDHPRILLSPHVAFLSDAAEREYVVRQAENVLRWWQDSDPVTPVGV